MSAAARFGRGVFAGALFAAAVVAAVPARDATRDELIARWVAASHRSPQLLDEKPDAATPPPSLASLALRELAIPGRYHVSQAAPLKAPAVPWWERLYDWLGDRWNQLWQMLFGRAHLGRANTFVLGPLLTIGATIVLLWAVLRLLGELQIVRGSRVRSLETLTPAAGARALYERACRQAASGDYAGASLLLFAATLGALDLRGVVRDDASATVGDLRRALRARDPDSIASFDSVASAFVTSAYAQRPVEPAQWARAHDAYVSLAHQAQP